MSLLYGIAIEKGYLRLDQTLEELGINDRIVPLTKEEKTCNIRDLLMSRSGIYIESPGETKEMKSNRPKRGQHKPGEFFYYNNWGFNVLGTIFEKQTKLTIGEAFEEWLAIPLGMKHFNQSFVEYKDEHYTEHRQYIIYLSAEDFARIGMLMVNHGQWKGNQIVSRNWIEESTRPYSICGIGNEPLNMYSYLWWNDTIHETVWATGWGGQFMLLDMKNKLVIVSRNDTKRTLLGQGLFLIKSKQGYRSEHQKMYELIKLYLAD
jgi:CubicO group peptidase (beta-lactamase class C family)